MSHSHKDGFTLLELAIVLAIIGLIVAGITAGGALINAAERRTILSDVARYVAAVDAFQQKYEALPGDMYNATDIWGEEHALLATCRITASTSKLTCNGDGDNKIGEAGNAYEMFRAWQQLANAGFIDGRFTGRSTSAIDDDSSATKGANANVPLSTIDNAGYTMRWIGSTTADPYFDSTDYGHVFIFGKPATDTITSDPIFIPEEAWAMDDKNDDGMPGTGKIRTHNNSAQSDCVDTDTTATADYETEEENIECNLVFVTGF